MDLRVGDYIVFKKKMSGLYGNDKYIQYGIVQVHQIYDNTHVIVKTLDGDLVARETYVTGYNIYHFANARFIRVKI